MSWHLPPVWNQILRGETTAPKNSKVLREQKLMLDATFKTLTEIAKDVREGLLETVGVESSLVVNEKCSIVVEMPQQADPKLIASAIDAENLESWCDENDKVHVGISPWYSTKDVDQTVLCTTKIIHVVLGMHASDAESSKPKSLSEKILSSISDIMTIQKKVEK